MTDGLAGVDGLTAALEQLGERVVAATPLAVVTARAIVEGVARASLSRYSHHPGTPTPSPPGEPPALVTGRLRSSFEVAGPTAEGVGVWSAALGPTVPYARIQELGGRAGRGRRVELPARPYLRPAVEESVRSGRIAEVFTRAWAQAVTG